MEGLEITVLDQALILGYFFFVFGFGAYFGKYIKSTTDYFFSGRKFGWWVISFSMVATIVGSYSFIKYSEKGFTHGLSSSMSYLNDWFFLPLWMFAWLPIIYFTRLKSVPEYFERRFDTATRFMAILFITVYLVGYIGINFYTLGVALNPLIGESLGLGVFGLASIVAVATAIYVTSGGQTAVIMTDLLQGVLLLAAGITIFLLGLHYIGDGSIIDGLPAFWRGLPEDHRYALAEFNEPPKFSFIGVFWQDAVASSFAAYFFNQGILMRFLALKSVNEGRKALTVCLMVLFPIAVLAVGNAGWLGASMYHGGLWPSDAPSATADPNDIFVIVTNILAHPGVFGLIMAALLAALMSSADTLINATSAVVINDIWRPYLVKGRSDRYYLRAAQVSSIAAALAGLALVPVFMRQKSIYEAHGLFIATVTPPMAVCILLGFLWPRYTARAAFATLLGGGIAMALVIVYPDLASPFAHGVDPSGDFKYMRALYGVVVSAVIGIGVTFVTRPSRTAEELVGLTITTIRESERRFKGGEPNREEGDRILATLEICDEDAIEYIETSEGDVATISVHPDDLAVMKARPGDMLFIADARWWMSSLRAAHLRVHDDKGKKGVVSLPKSYVERNNLLPGREVVMEKLL